MIPSLKITFVLSLSVILFSGAYANEENKTVKEVRSTPVLKHGNCKISGVLLAEIFLRPNVVKVLMDKGFTFDKYKFYYPDPYSENGQPEVVEKYLDSDKKEIDRNWSLDGGKAELEAMLGAIHHSYAYRIYRADGTFKTYNPDFSGLLHYTTTEPIRVEWIHSFKQAFLKKSDKRWYYLGFKPTHEYVISGSKVFALQSAAKEILSQPSIQEDFNKGILKMIAGKNVTDAAKNKYSNEKYLEAQYDILDYELLKEINGDTKVDELDKLINLSLKAFPTCELIEK